ncbi:AAA family ATPase [Winogradskyella sp. MIT101101]|uniref:AAA family ATPase n=1 Tax=Winogradskyella sp. MIT101101 TaxID=3098297 RepID=UPI00399A7115
MINKINIENFKCYEKIEFDTSKVTLLTGANSSGKSSLLYSILGAIQSREFPFQFSPNGKYIKMGDFEEIVHNHDKSKLIKLEFEDDEEKQKVTTYWSNDKVRNLPVLEKLYAESEVFSLKIEKVRKYDLKFEYFIDKDPNSYARSPEMIKKIMEIVESSIKTEKEGEEKIKGKFEKIKTKIEFKFSDFNELEELLRNEQYYYLSSFKSSISSMFNRFDDKINYISSFRLYPERTYYETSKKDLKVGKFGENYEDQIIAWETKKSPEYKELISILKDLGLLHEIKSKRLDGGRFEILIRTKANGVWSSLSDVGFGISQFLPIIVADLQLGKRSTLFIAQPEIHLHPRIQAQFGDYLVNRITKENKRYIIETHSEYLINRIRLAIAKKTISQQDVKTYFIDNNGIKAKHYNLSFLKNGQIKNAPKSFFETYMLDVMNIAIEAE